jgi:hypothetical protein
LEIFSAILYALVSISRLYEEFTLLPSHFC